MIYLPDYFLRQTKQYRKKFKNIENDLVNTLQNFHKETAIPLGHKLYKLRLKSRDIPKGKNSSFRIIIFILETPPLLVPITIYFKSDKSNINEKEIEHHLAMVLKEIEAKKIL